MTTIVIIWLITVVMAGEISARCMHMVIDDPSIQGDLAVVRDNIWSCSTLLALSMFVWPLTLLWLIFAKGK